MSACDIIMVFIYIFFNLSKGNSDVNVFFSPSSTPLSASKNVCLPNSAFGTVQLYASFTRKTEFNQIIGCHHCHYFYAPSFCFNVRTAF